MISIIIPTLNAARTLGPTLGALGPGVAAGTIREVIFADGGSTDETAEIAAAVGADFLSAPGGRAMRLRAGAAAARGAWLLFLNPDTRLSPDWPEVCRAHIAARPAATGWFALRFAGGGAGSSLRAAAANLRARTLGLPSPDHALLAPRCLAASAGGSAARRGLAALGLEGRLGRARLAPLRSVAVAHRPVYDGAPDGPAVRPTDATQRGDAP